MGRCPLISRSDYHESDFWRLHFRPLASRGAYTPETAFPNRGRCRRIKFVSETHFDISHVGPETWSRIGESGQVRIWAQSATITLQRAVGSRKPQRRIPVRTSRDVDYKRSAL